MCIISLDEEKFKLLFDVLFVTVAFINPEISPSYQSGSAPLVSIFKPAISVLLEQILFPNSTVKNPMVYPLYPLSPIYQYYLTFAD